MLVARLGPAVVHVSIYICNPPIGAEEHWSTAQTMLYSTESQPGTAYVPCLESLESVMPGQTRGVVGEATEQCRRGGKEKKSSTVIVGATEHRHVADLTSPFLGTTTKQGVNSVTRRGRAGRVVPGNY